MEFPEIGITANLLRGIMERRPVPPGPVDPATPAPEVALAQDEAPLDPGTRAGRMEAILRGLCGRPGVRGALLADSSGLAMAIHGGPFPAERLAAFSTMLGSALDGAGRLLDSRGADRISLRLSEAETALLARFPCEGLLFHLLVLCLPAVAERVDVRPAVAGLQRVLAGPTRAGSDAG
jgi:hypothetical protein